MIEFVLASRNKHKISELRALLAKYIKADFELLSLDDIGFEGDIVEDGSSFEENSIIKASVPARLGYIGIADDSGLEVDALNGEPGIYSARYAGEPCNDNNNNMKLLERMRDIPEGKRSAHYTCVMSAVFPDGNRITAKGECSGKILFEPRGNGGFGYDPLFYSFYHGKTFAEISAEEKNVSSHRSKAIEAFATKLNEYPENK